MAQADRLASLKRVVVVGAGFGGLRVARSLRRAPVQVVLLDRNNYHLFQPLLYQVATAGLEPEQIAKPVRAILRGQKNFDFGMVEVTGDMAVFQRDSTERPCCRNSDRLYWTSSQRSRSTAME